MPCWVVPQLIRLLEQSHITPRYLQPSKPIHTDFEFLRGFIAGVRFRDGLQPSVDVRLLFFERFRSFSGGFDMVIGGFGGIRQ